VWTKEWVEPGNKQRVEPGNKQWVDPGNEASKKHTQTVEMGTIHVPRPVHVQELGQQLQDS